MIFRESSYPKTSGIGGGPGYSTTVSAKLSRRLARSPISVLPLLLAATLVPSLVPLPVLSTVSARETCYFPDGVTVDGDGYACNASSAATASQCCRTFEVCLDGGACYTQFDSVIYRRSCTDATWADPACPKECVDVNKGGTVGLSRCSGNTKPQYCCETGDDPNGSCCTSSNASTFFFIPGGVEGMLGGDGALQSFGGGGPSTVLTSSISSSTTTQATTTTSPTDTATPTGTATSSSSSSQPSPTVVGLSVGIAVAVVAAVAAAAAALFYFRRRRRSNKGNHHGGQGVGDERELSAEESAVVREMRLRNNNELGVNDRVAELPTEKKKGQGMLPELDTKKARGQNY